MYNTRSKAKEGATANTNAQASVEANTNEDTNENANNEGNSAMSLDADEDVRMGDTPPTSNAHMHVNTMHRAPRPFSGKKGEDWRSWFQRMELYFDLSKMPRDDRLKSLLMHLEGVAFRIAEQLKVKSMHYIEGTKVLKEIFQPPENSSEFRAKFHERSQAIDEPYETFARDLRLLASLGFPAFTAPAVEQLAITRFISGIRNGKTSERIFMKTQTR